MPMKCPIGHFGETDLGPSASVVAADSPPLAAAATDEKERTRPADVDSQTLCHKLIGQLHHCPHHQQRFDEAKAFPLALIAAA